MVWCFIVSFYFASSLSPYFFFYLSLYSSFLFIIPAYLFSFSLGSLIYHFISTPVFLLLLLSFHPSTILPSIHLSFFLPVHSHYNLSSPPSIFPFLRLFLLPFLPISAPSFLYCLLYWPPHSFIFLPTFLFFSHFYWTLSYLSFPLLSFPSSVYLFTPYLSFLPSFHSSSSHSWHQIIHSSLLRSFFHHPVFSFHTLIDPFVHSLCCFYHFWCFLFVVA